MFFWGIISTLFFLFSLRFIAYIGLKVREKRTERVIRNLSDLEISHDDFLALEKFIWDNTPWSSGTIKYYIYNHIGSKDWEAERRKERYVKN